MTEGVRYYISKRIMKINYVNRKILFGLFFILLASTLYAQISNKAKLKIFPRYDHILELESTVETSANVEFGDLNGDGNLDIVLAKGRHWPLINRVLFGDGKGGILRSHDLGTVADRSYSGRLVDIDKDGDLDVVISNDKPDLKLVYFNDGKGSFEVVSKFGHPDWPTRNSSIADLNNDGFPDIVIANRSKNPGIGNYICLNDGNGKIETDYIAFSHYPATTITPADFNNDGLIDLAVPHRDNGQSYVFIQTDKGELNFNQIPFGPPTASIRMSQAADFDSDGRIDIAAIDTKQGVIVYFQEENNSFSSGISLGNQSASPYALAVSDLNLDGLVDIIVGYVKASSAAYFNEGNGKSFFLVQFGDDQGTVYGFDVADFNNDGKPDIAVARSGATNIIYLANSSNRK